MSKDRAWEYLLPEFECKSSQVEEGLSQTWKGRHPWLLCLTLCCVNCYSLLTYSCNAPMSACSWFSVCCTSSCHVFLESDSNDLRYTDQTLGELREDKDEGSRTQKSAKWLLSQRKWVIEWYSLLLHYVTWHKDVRYGVYVTPWERELAVVAVCLFQFWSSCEHEQVL